MDVIMPQLGETVTEGVVTKWYRKAGEPIRADEVLFDVETEKVSTEIPAPASGIISEILVSEGETAKVGARLCVISEGAATAAQPENVQLASSSAAGTAGQRMSPTAAYRDDIAQPPYAAPPAGAQGRLSPVVRRLLDEHELDAAQIPATGRDGRLTRDDVVAYIASKTHGAGDQARAGRGAQQARSPVQSEAGKPLPLSALRRRVAENVLNAWTHVPHVLQIVEADFHRVEQARREHGARWKAAEGFSLTYLPFVACAVSAALRQYPRLNALFSSDQLTMKSRINLGIAVDLNFEGLIVPVVKDTAGKSLAQLAREINDLAARARAGKLEPDELTEGTYTLTNNGVYGTVMTAPIINAPQIAILSTDAVRKKAVVREGTDGDSIAIRPVGVLAQSFDHRAVDGAYAAAFLRELKLVIETRDWLDDLQREVTK